MLLCDRTDFFQRLDGSDLIVGSHNRNQNGIRTDGSFQLVQFHFTIFVYSDISYFISVFFKPLCRMQDCMMFNRCCNNMLSFICISFRSCFQCPVIGLASAAGEVNFIRFCTDRFCDSLTCMIHTTLCLSRKAVDCGWITVILGKIW